MNHLAGLQRCGPTCPLCHAPLSTSQSPLAPIDPAAPDIFLSIVAPCFNEEATVTHFFQRADAVCQTLGKNYEIILVNDGSKDQTWSLLQSLAAQSPHVLAVNLSRNHGHQLALSAGLSLSRGQNIAILDADLQDPPELIPDMLKLIDTGADVVYGQRSARDGETLFKRASAALFYRLCNKLSDIDIPPDTGDFRVLSRRALNVLLQMPEYHRFIRGMVSWIGFQQLPFLYKRDPRFAGKTNYTLRKMIRFAIDAITAFSIKPLRLASLTGFIAAAVALCLFLWSVYSWLFLKAVPGWTTLMAGVALFSRAQLIVIGILGEYLGRLYEQSKARPLFIIQNIIHHPSQNSPPSATPPTVV